MKNRSGFTLIELMIVVSIIGILAAVSLPAYQDYTQRAKVVEAITIVGEIKPQIIAYYKDKGRFPTNNAQAGAPKAEFIIGNFVKKATVEQGAIHVEMGNKVSDYLKGKILTLRPIVVTGSPLSPVSWVCGNSKPPEGMVAVGENKTSLSNQMLPSNCRS